VVRYFRDHGARLRALRIMNDLEHNLTGYLSVVALINAGVGIGSGIIAAVAQEHAERAFDFAIANLAKVNGLVESSSRAGYFPALASGSSSPAMVDKLKAYAEANLPASARSQTNTAVSRMQYRAAVIRDRMPEIDAWLDRQAL
jgi:aminopeptidase N